MIKFLFAPGVDTGNEFAVIVYTESGISDLQEELLRLLDEGKPGDRLLIVKGEAHGVEEEKELEGSIINTDAQGITPDMWELMDSYLEWLNQTVEEKGENDD